MSAKKPVLIIVAGPNGSGKTTVTSKILRHQWLEDSVYINPDNVAQERFGDWNSESAVLKAAKYCEEWREQCLVEKRSMIFETVFSSDEKVRFVERAVEAGFFVRLFFVCTSSPTINAARIAGRVMKGGHDVPISKIVSRYQKSILNCKFVIKSVQRVYLYDNSVENGEAQLLIRYADGRVAKRYCASLPEWAKQITE
ncbi:MAG: zeta toxin family protein [Paludibacteraceae bacterium]|nr:zeta toxin family protein [Paludibacteraceae bacterium]MBO7507256.1 zeta toxin family protein [Paludibacteraceae bacterium]MBR3520221.1 zeta toxin family protein [Paludibacteraceae bacterium]MBR4712086.1 zeta toxin family protein [Paludibacteraceae bacterium]